jgi:hypothetical protein
MRADNSANGRDASAADALDQSQGDQAEPRDDTFYLPSDFPGADALKEGDTISLKVVSKSEDGEIEVEQVSDNDEQEPDADDMGAALDKHMGSSKSY